MLAGQRLHPHRVKGRQQLVERQRLGDNAAAGGENQRPRPFHHRAQRLLLEPAIAILPVELEHLGHGETSGALDLLIEFDEIPAKPLGGETPDGGFARAAQADQRHAINRARRRRRLARPAVERLTRALDRRGRGAAQQFAKQRPVGGLRALADKILQRRARRARHLAQQHDGKIARPAFKLGEITLGYAGDPRERLAGHAAQGAGAANALAKFGQIGRVGGDFWRGLIGFESGHVRNNTSTP